MKTSNFTFQIFRSTFYIICPQMTECTFCPTKFQTQFQNITYTLIQLKESNQSRKTIYTMSNKKHAYSYDNSHIQSRELASNTISGLQKYSQCPQCQQYESIIKQLSQKNKKLIKRQLNLKRAFQKLQIQNNSVVSDTDEVIKNFQHHIYKLESQLYERQNIVNQISEQVRYLQQQNTNLQQKLTAQNKEVLEKYQAYRTEVQSLQKLVLKQLSEKSLVEKSVKQECRKFQVEKFQLREEIKSMEERIQEKQGIIKKLSESNNQLRMEMIQKKLEGELQEFTWVTEKKKILQIDCGDSLKQLRKQNDQLKVLNKSLQFEIKNLIKQAQDIETVLVKTKLQRDILKKIIEQEKDELRQMKYERRSHNSRDGKIRSGSIYRNVIQMPGLIRFNKNHGSMKTSVSNQIIQEDLQANNSLY